MNHDNGEKPPPRKSRSQKATLAIPHRINKPGKRYPIRKDTYKPELYYTNEMAWSMLRLVQERKIGLTGQRKVERKNGLISRKRSNIETLVHECSNSNIR